ncbi:unnamed protein product [Cuscuta campestris]|uniref:Uncharacterized protein n=1 Tax=Cuscuta campestris TaxID=132261 RepID=A0A484L594_9ASTE|nr:unnamed protein product [Cuscuta campestris]
MSRQLFQLISSLDGLMVMKQPRRQLSPKTIKPSLIQSIPPGPSLTQYLDDVATILLDLDALKEEIPERDVVNAVIRGLPTEYSSFKQNIRMNNTNISLNQLSGWLISEEINLEMENKLSLTESTITEPRTALLATNGRGNEESREFLLNCCGNLLAGDGRGAVDHWWAGAAIAGNRPWMKAAAIFGTADVSMELVLLQIGMFNVRAALHGQ